jgi:N utilization substance protein B
MPASSLTRRKAREVALQGLYQIDIVAAIDELFLHRFITGRLRTVPLVEFCKGLIEGVSQHREEIDLAIEERAENWRLSRMTVVDRSLLRIAAYEILYTDVPPAVAADEAVELAKRYGAESSPRFVAGILAKLIADRSGPQSLPASAADTPAERN